MDKRLAVVLLSALLMSPMASQAEIPLVAKNDKHALEAALRSCGHLLPDKEKIIRIRDTLHLDELYVSPGVMSEIENDPAIETIEENINLFNIDGDLTSF